MTVAHGDSSCASTGRIVEKSPGPSFLSGLSQHELHAMKNPLHLNLVVDGQCQCLGAIEEFPFDEAGIAFSEIPINQASFGVTLQRRGPGEWFVSINTSATAPVELFASVEYAASFNEAGYTLIPGIYYNGNNTEPVKAIPAMTGGSGFRFEAPLSACAIPVLAQWDGRQTASVLRGDPFTRVGSSGFVLDANEGRGSLWFPALEANRYQHGPTRQNKRRRGVTMERGDVFSFAFSFQEYAVGSIADLFHMVNKSCRGVSPYGDRASSRLPFHNSVQLVVDWVVKRHLVRGANDEPMFLNAFIDGAHSYGHPEFPAEWCQIIGWCGGPMTAYALLAFESPVRDLALANLDFLAKPGFTASGLPHAMFDGHQWLTPLSTGGFGYGWNHPRIAADYATYLLRAYRREKEQGHDHADWLTPARQVLAVFCDLWERAHDFGYLIDPNQSPLAILEEGSCAGAFVLLALSEGIRVLGPEPELVKTFQEAGEYYHSRFIAKGHCTGGPLDIRRADDSESAAAFAEAFLAGFQLLGDRTCLQYSEEAAQIFGTWVLSYGAPFPPGSTTSGINPCGGVLANVQNRHVGPGICTNSGRFLYDLGQITGDEWYTNRYRDVVIGASNFVCPRDGAWLGCGREGKALPFMAGMVSEQINLSDSLNEAGEMWAVSAGWPATAILLSWMERAPQPDFD